MFGSKLTRRRIEAAMFLMDRGSLNFHSSVVFFCESGAPVAREPNLRLEPQTIGYVWKSFTSRRQRRNDRCCHAPRLLATGVWRGLAYW